MGDWSVTRRNLSDVGDFKEYIGLPSFALTSIKAGPGAKMATHHTFRSQALSAA